MLKKLEIINRLIDKYISPDITEVISTDKDNPVIKIISNKIPTHIEFDRNFLDNISVDDIEQDLISREFQVFVLQNKGYKILITEDKFSI